MKNMKKKLISMACALAMLVSIPALVNFTAEPASAEAVVESAKTLKEFSVRSTGYEAGITYQVFAPGTGGKLVVQHVQSGEVVFEKAVQKKLLGRSVVNLPKAGQYRVVFKSGDPTAVKGVKARVSVVVKIKPVNKVKIQTAVALKQISSKLK